MEILYSTLSIIIIIISFLTLIVLFFNSQLKKIILHIKDFNLKKLKFQPIKKRYLIYKRILDIYISLVFLIIMLPLNIIIMCCIKIFDGGNIFEKVYKTDCLTNKKYILYKFKTLNSKKTIFLDNNKIVKEDSLYALVKDFRITKFGSFLRAYSLDSLPKFYNVLKGDISLIGRNFYKLGDYPKDIIKDYQIEILASIPIGLISLWSISYSKIFYGKRSFNDIIYYDLIYASNASLIFDLYIYFKTIFVTIGIKASK